MTNPNNGETVKMTIPELLDGTNPYAPDVATVAESTDSGELLSTARKLSAALDRSADYGLTLWKQLEVVATYLREDIAHARVSDERATLLQTEQQRRRWQQVYSEVLSALAGPGGDSGYGEQQARLEMQNHALPTGR